jgi:glycerol kinase
MAESILVIDAGTTSTRAMLFGADGAASVSSELPALSASRAGSSRPEEIWEKSLACARAAWSDKAGGAAGSRIVLTTQR